MGKAVCLVSGGLDSCVSAAIAQSRGLQPAFLHVTYGQRTAGRELRAFEDLANHYGIRDRLVADIGYLGRIGGSALTDPSIPIPDGQLNRPGIPVSYVPFRNAQLLSIATSWAEVLEAESIYLGAVEEDSSGYPDCRECFFQAFNRVIALGTRDSTTLVVVTPLIRLRKREIIQRGIELGAPLESTWSCYQESEVACGRCDSCLLRLRGFRELEMRDPLPYRSLPTLP